MFADHPQQLEAATIDHPVLDEVGTCRDGAELQEP